MNIPKVKYFIQCDEVRNEGGKFSATGIFDTIYSFIFPSTHQRFHLLIGCVGAEGKYDLEVQFTAPDGNVYARATGELILASDWQVGNAVFVFERFPLPTEGRYTVTVFLNGDFFLEHFFNVQPPFEKHDRTPEQISLLLSQPDIVKSANVDISCDVCKAVYRFQHHLDPQTPADTGFLLLPSEDMFSCAVCGRQMNLQRLRRNLENIVGIPKQWLGSGQKGSPKSPPPQSGAAQSGPPPMRPPVQGETEEQPDKPDAD